MEQSIKPSRILKSLNAGIKTSLIQTEENDESAIDGMDLALYAVNTVTKTI